MMPCGPQFNSGGTDGYQRWPKYSMYICVKKTKKKNLNNIEKKHLIQVKVSTGSGMYLVKIE